jgi:ABC-type thiamin/hydroxymethylpyrimidine transport system permease subunit
MDTINNIPIYSVQPVSQRKVDTPQFTPAGALITTLTIASAVTIGSNMVDVQNGSMTMPQALLNGVAKGTAATLILNVTARSTTLQVAMAAGILASAGYLIDSAMKKNKQELCLIEESRAK